VRYSVITSLEGGQSVLKRVDGTRLKHALSDIIKCHREVSISLSGFKSIEKEGYRIPEEMKRNADQKKCRIRFINVGPQVLPAINKLMEKKAQLQDELELN
jgi:pimeloyl-CoA synthetase